MAKHTIVKGEVFLEGANLGICVNVAGTLGGAQNAPEGFKTDLSDPTSKIARVGMMTKLPKLTREMILRGTVIEGFVLSYTIDGMPKTFKNSLRQGFHDIKGGITADVSTDALMGSIWSALTPVDGLTISQKMTFKDGDKAVRVDVDILNTSGKTIQTARYARFLDPDPDGSFNTRNEVVMQEKASIIAGFGKTPNYPTFLISFDDRSLASALPFKEGHDLNIHNPKIWTKTLEGPVVSGDTVLIMGWELGDLAPGATTSITYWFGVCEQLEGLAATLGLSAPAPVTPTPPVVTPVDPEPPVVVAPATKYTKPVAKLLVDKSPGDNTIKITTSTVAKTLGVKQNSEVIDDPVAVEGGFIYPIKGK